MNLALYFNRHIQESFIWVRVFMIDVLHEKSNSIRVDLILTLSGT
jgi:hypothetical protein